MFIMKRNRTTLCLVLSAFMGAAVMAQTGKQEPAPKARPAQAAEPTGGAGASVLPTLNPAVVGNEVRKAFEEWQDAYSAGATTRFLLCFAQIPDLMIRISSNAWLGFENYRDALATVEMPKTDFPFRDVRVTPVDENAAIVTYKRAAAARDEHDRPLSYWGTLVYARTYSGWKVVAWHTHAVVDSGP
jgi:ketosteroid isomerase-like protein